MQITLHRTGSFTFDNPNVDFTNQCGFKLGDRQVWFDVLIESDSEHLDENGFVLDNNAVQAYFVEKYNNALVFPSCERIAIAAISDLCDIMGKDRCRAISVEIKPGDYAGIRASQTFDVVASKEPQPLVHKQPEQLAARGPMGFAPVVAQAQTENIARSALGFDSRKPRTNRDPESSFFGD